MNRTLISTFGLVIFATAPASILRSEVLKISAIRLWTYDETTRIAVEISGEFQYHVERLHNPERIFFDIHNAKPALTGKRGIAPADDKLVRRIRVAETEPDVTRIVIDLTGQAEFTASQ